MLSDVHYALRGLRRHRTFAAAAVLSLALGIGINAAIFTVLDRLLLQPLPYADADRLVILWNRSPGLNITQDWFSTAQYFDIRQSASFDEVAIALGVNCNLAGDGVDPERVGCVRVSSNLLPMLGARAARGRLLDANEDAPGRSPVALLSHGTWVRRYGRDPAIVGRTIRLNDQPHEIVGILPEGFALPREVLPTLAVAEAGEIFLPLPLTAASRTDRGHEDYNVVARLTRGTRAAAAQAEMDTLTARLRRDFPDVYPPNGGLTFGVVPLLEQVVGAVRRPLWILLGAVGCVLLIACANVANLLLSRALAREHEFAVRVALGASRARIARQVLVDSAIVSIAGAAAGLVCAGAAVRALRALQPANVPRLDSISVDPRVVLFTLVVTAIAAALSGLAPALDAGRAGAAMSATRGTTAAGGIGARRWGVRFVLVVAELSLSCILLAGAGLLVRSFAHLQHVAPGFESRGVLTFELMTTGRQYANAQAVRDAYRRLWDEIDRLPGVTASGGVTSLPLSGFFAWGPITIEGRTPPEGETFINADQRVVSGRYFQAMNIPLRRGRFFEPTDTPDAPRVAIIDERMSDDFWPGEDPIGKRLRNGDARSTSPWITIVGVVGRVKQYALDSDSRIAFYTPQSQAVGRSLYVVVKHRGEAAAVTPAVTRAVHVVDPNLPLYRVQTMEAVVEGSLSRQRFSTALLTAFAATALTLALVGMYGVMSHLVSLSARDLGIRMALGATSRAILAWVLRRAAAIVAVGSALGFAGALALNRVLRGFVSGIETTDAAAFAAATALLIVTALVASYIPARRATRIDPLRAIHDNG